MENDNRTCKNCNSQLQDAAVFCHHCGQKYRSGKPTLWMVLGDFFSSIFNLDSSVYRSLLGIFKPGKLTKAFFQGKFKSYAPPIRVFIVSSVFLIAVLSFITNSEQSNLKDSALYKFQRVAIMKEIRELKPVLHQQFPDSSTYAVVDSLLQGLGNIEDLNDSISILSFNNTNGDFSIGTTKEIASTDIFRLPEDTLFHNYQIESFINKQMARQQIKNIKDEGSLEKYVISRLTIQTLLMMPIVALLLKLLYWRRNHYFIDHFVFSLHYHSFAFILLGISAILYYFIQNDWVFILLLLIPVYLFMAMKQVYQQSVVKTILKFLILNVVYFFVLTVFALFAILFSFLIF